MSPEPAPKNRAEKTCPRNFLEDGVSRDCKNSSAFSPGCLLTIILLMRALDPLLYEKETLQYFHTLKAS